MPQREQKYPGERGQTDGGYGPILTTLYTSSHTRVSSYEPCPHVVRSWFELDIHQGLLQCIVAPHLHSHYISQRIKILKNVELSSRSWYCTVRFRDACVSSTTAYLDGGIEREMLPAGEGLKEGVELRAVTDKTVDFLGVLANVKA